MRFTGSLTVLLLLVQLLGVSGLYRLPCSYADTWQEKRRCACTNCAWYKTVSDECVPPDAECSASALKIASPTVLDQCQSTVNSKNGMFGYCTRGNLINNYDKCCKFDWGFRIPLIFAILIIDFALFNWWFNRFQFLLQCLVPTIQEIVAEVIRILFESGGEMGDEEGGDDE